MRHRSNRAAAGWRSPLALLVAIAGCARPDVLLICHNGNCAGPTDPARDDTEAALRESLALTYDGRPMLDGVELDLFWDRENARCLFAHELGTVADPLGATEAAAIVAEYFATPGDIAWNGETFFVQLELKGFVGSLGTKHTADDARAHADCALEVTAILEAAALDFDRRLVTTLDSTAPIVLRELPRRPGWPGKRTGEQVSIRLSADFSDPTSTGLIFNTELSETAGIELDNVVVHPAWMSYGVYQTFRSLDVDISLWMFSATAETFDALDRFEVAAALTSEAPLLRRWLER